MIAAMRLSFMYNGSVFSLFTASLRFILISSEIGRVEHTYASVCPTNVVAKLIDWCIAASTSASRTAETASWPTMVAR